MKFNSAEEFFTKQDKWHEALLLLREIFISTGLKESLKWGMPAYSYDGKNIAGLGAFKSYFGIWFHQGALLADDAKVLVNAQEGKTKALRQWRFKSIKEIDPELVRAYILEAIENQKVGKVISSARKKKLVVPAELQSVLEKNNTLNKAFINLSFGKQREYADYISDAKREATKQNRLEKILPLIKDGIGLYDKYKNC